MTYTDSVSEMDHAATPTVDQQFTVGVVGASGYSGAELLRVVAGHPNFQLQLATGDSKAGTRIADLYPHLAAHYKQTTFQPFDDEQLAWLDVVFVALPHGVSMTAIPKLLGRVGHIVDLGSDFRLHEPDLYPQWYGAEHCSPELLPTFRYGLPELFRPSLRGAERIAATGCNAASAILALAPFVEAEAVEPQGMLVDLKTGVSGAGRPPKESTTFCTVNENIAPYKVVSHRHTPEIEQAITERTGSEVSVLFTPHLVPVSRGILATCYIRPTQSLTTDDAIGLLTSFYHNEPFVVVDERLPMTKAVTGSNAVHLSARVDNRTGYVIVISCLDNLMKGASGMAIQNANLALGLPETTGLTTIGVYP